MYDTKGKNEQNTHPILTFQVITDTHVTGDSEHVHNRNLNLALQDIVRHAPDSDGIMHVGDVTDHGFPQEYEELKRIWSENEQGLPQALFALGNHDVGLGVWEDRLDRFLTATNMSAPYHDHWIKGYHFIFLGTEEGLPKFCTLSQEQLEWLDAKLSEGEGESDKPAFLFLHQPLMDTVAGSLESQDWYGVTQDVELKAVLAKHHQAILFTGHTHWELGTPRTFYDGAEVLPAMFNAASIGYLWTDEDEHKSGSQGYYVEVYSDKVLVKGRDFEKGAWVEEAQFEVSIVKLGK